MKKSFTLYVRHVHPLMHFLSALLFVLLFSCSDESRKYEKEKEEGAESLRGFDLWSEMRTYPFKQLVAKNFAPGFEKSRSMTLQARAQQLGRDLPMTDPWSDLGPKNFSGRIISLAFHPTNPNIMFAGSASGGLWKTTNGGYGNVGGINWQYIPTGFPVLGVGSIAINPSNPNEMYIGTGEVYNPSALGTGSTGAGHIRLFRGSYGIGILKSTDGGVSWTKSLDFSNSNIKGVMDLVIHPTTPSTVWAATSDGVYRTTNSGTTWQLVHNITMPMSIVLKPGNPNIMFVGCGNFGSAGSGIYKCTNANAATPTYTKLTTGLPASYSGKIQLSMTPANTNVVYASIGDNPDNPLTTRGLYKSSDEGATWTAIRTNTNSIIGNQGWYAHDVAVSSASSTLILWGELNTYRSTNSGTNITNTGIWSEWDVNNTQIGDLTEGQNDANPTDYVHADVHRILCSPHDASGNTFFLCTDGGIFRTTDGGFNFNTLNGGLNTAQIYANMAISPTNVNYMLLGLQDNEAAVYQGSAGMRRIGSLGDGFHAAIKSSGTIQFVESYYFNFRKSSDAGATWAAGSGAVPELACFNVPMVYSLTAGSAYMFAGTIYFKRSTNDGVTWTNLNGGAPISGANNPIISMVAPNNNTVYFSTAPGGGIRSRLYKTTNATAGSPTFTNITGTLPDRYYSDIAVDPSDANRLAVTLSGFGSSHVYLSNDGGANWTDIGGGLPDVPTNTIAFDPTTPGAIYIGNDIGVYYANGVPTGSLGASVTLTWTAYNEGFTDAVMVSDLLITSTGKIRMGSYGRGLWERDLAPNIVLPASIISFTASRNSGVNELEWVMARENGVKEYQVEYSADGNIYTVIGKIPPAGSGPKENQYRFGHTTGAETASYYRIRVLDLDGSSQYSKVVKIGAQPFRNEIFAYPNPTAGMVRIHIPGNRNMQLAYRVIDGSGKTLLSRKIEIVQGRQEFTIDLDKLPAGNYRILLEGNALRWSGSVLKVK
jgi:hypothetical protein